MALFQEQNYEHFQAILFTESNFIRWQLCFTILQHLSFHIMYTTTTPGSVHTGPIKMGIR